MELLVWTLLFLGTFLETASQQLKYDQLFNLFEANERCITIYLDKDYGGYSNTQRFVRQQVQLDLDQEMPTFKQKTFLARNDWCTVVIVGRNESRLLGALLDLTKPIRRNIIYAIDSAAPSSTVLRDMNNLMVWQHLNKEQTLTKLEVFCPKVGKPKVPKAKLAVICTRDRCRYKQGIQDLSQSCPSPFRGQVVTASLVPVRPFMFKSSGRMAGYAYNLFMALGQYLKFTPSVNINTPGKFLPQNSSFTPGMHRDVIKGNADITFSGLLLFMSPFFDFGSPMVFVELKFITRSPIPKTTYGNITKPFSLWVWLFSVLSVGACSVMLLITYKMYTSESFSHYKLVAYYEASNLNFFIYPFVKITEPDPLPWFSTWSTGKIVVFWWGVLALFLNMFYTSNLRAYLVTVDYEKPIDTLEDVVSNGQRVYMHYSAARLRSAYLEATGQAGSVKHRIAKLAERTGGMYDDLMENRAVALVESVGFPHLSVMNKLLTRENIRVCKETVLTYYQILVLKKHSPGLPDLNLVSRIAFDLGLQSIWQIQYSPPRALLKLKPKQVALKPILVSNLYTSLMFYSAGMLVALVAFFSEKPKLARGPRTRQRSRMYPEEEEEEEKKEKLPLWKRILPPMPRILKARRRTREEKIFRSRRNSSSSRRGQPISHY